MTMVKVESLTSDARQALSDMTQTVTAFLSGVQVEHAYRNRDILIWHDGLPTDLNPNVYRFRVKPLPVKKAYTAEEIQQFILQGRPGGLWVREKSHGALKQITGISFKCRSMHIGGSWMPLSETASRLEWIDGSPFCNVVCDD